MQKQQQKPVSALKLTLRASEDKGANQWEEAKGTNVNISEEEEAFQQVHREYLELKMARKKEIQARKKQEFGVSSSQEDDVGASESDSGSEKRKSTLEEQSRFRQSQKMKGNQFSKELKCPIFFSIKKGKQTWYQETLTFSDQSLLINQKHFLLKQVHKIKMIQGTAVADCNRIKLSFIDQSQIYLGVNGKIFRDLPLNYYVFAFVVQQKLINMGKRLFKCTAPSLPGIPEGLIKNSYIFGKISKKSSILGRWEERLVVINKDGIYGYKKFNEKHSIFIGASSVKQIWTRFEVEDNLLVIKILHNSTKTQLGVPLTEVLDRRSWLFSIYRLAFPF